MNYRTPKFENYGWGNSIKIIKNKITAKGHNLVNYDPKETVLRYEDKILGMDVEIELLFTMKSHKLYNIFLRCNKIAILHPILEILNSKYGEYTRKDNLSFIWELGDYSIVLIGRLSGHKEDVQLYYTSSFLQGLQNTENIESAERKFSVKEVRRF